MTHPLTGSYWVAPGQLLAGLMHGLQDLSAGWPTAPPWREELKGLVDRFATKCRP
ncbi:MAG: hypothetical protein KDK99_19395 [Verrucomicrobiales bacterium]|nr:hypothetical protein [Verrucomicrobiales bacterium]